MARIRSIKPEFWKSEAIARLDFFTRLVFIGLWSYVDDNGVGLDNPKLVAAELFPLEDDFAGVSRDLRESLARLSEAGRIIRYTVDGKAYLAIINWSEHQRIDRPNKPRYPGPDSPRATPTPPPSSPNGQPPRDMREGLAESSRGLRESPAPGAVEQGNRGTGELKPPALASLDADVIDAEIVDPPTVPLFVVPDPPAAEIAIPDQPNAGQLVRQWIDYCTANDVKLTTTAIKRYGRHVKAALDQGFHVDLIKHALGAMFADRVVSRPALLDNYLVRAQQGPERPPARMSRHQESAARLTPPGANPDDHLRDILTRLA